MTQAINATGKSASQLDIGAVVSAHPDGRFDVRLDGAGSVIICQAMRQPGSSTPAYRVADTVVIMRAHAEADHGTVIGLLGQSESAPHPIPEEVIIEANRQIVLRVGDSRIVVRSDRILIDGKEVATVAQGTNRIRGGCVVIN